MMVLSIVVMQEGRWTDEEQYTQHIVIDFEMNPISQEILVKGDCAIRSEIIEIGAVRRRRRSV